MWNSVRSILTVAFVIVSGLLLTYGITMSYISVTMFLPSYFPENATESPVTFPWDDFESSSCNNFKFCSEFIEKCEKEVDKFELNHENSREKFWKTTEKCFEAEKCLSCKNLNFYRVPHKFFMEHSNFPKCMTQFFKAVRENSFDECTKQFDFLSKSPPLKNIAYIDGTSCFLSFVSEHCDKNILGYLNYHYQSFVDLITIPTDYCGVYQKFQLLECKEISDSIVKSLSSRDVTQKKFGMISGICEDLQNCYANVYNDCLKNKELLIRTKEYCQKMQIFSTPMMQRFWI